MDPIELLRMQLDGNAVGAVTLVAIILLCAMFAGWD
jgi:hypothetical protein